MRWNRGSIVALMAALLAGPALAQAESGVRAATGKPPTVKTPTVKTPTVKAGVEAWQRGDHEAAVTIWRPLAAQGNADALFNLGQAYRLGRGVGVDLPTAQGLFERAARKGHLNAETSLGLLLFDNGNRTGAMRWLKSAAEHGEQSAMLIYGSALFNGDDVERDPVKAYAYVSRAAAQGLAPAKQALAQMDQIIPIKQRQKALAAAAESPPRPALDGKGGWRIQLGAFGQRSAAEALFRKLSTGSPLTGKQSYLVAAGRMTRLQAGPFESEAAATAACAALTARGQPCFAVAAR